MGNENTIWLIGASQMAVDYCKVLIALGKSFEVIGRGEKSAHEFLEATGVTPVIGGLEKHLLSNPIRPSFAIVAVGVEQLKNAAELLIRYEVKNILLEKPGGINIGEISSLNNLALEFGANVYIGYNRRFYSSVIKANEIICRDGGVTSFNFEFTEWSHIINNLEKAPGVKEWWFLSNSSHVIDMAFYMGGVPVSFSSYTAGEVGWHKPTIFAGAGIANTGALFSYSANWQAPGRWGIEILTAKHRLIFRPLEKLQIQNIGSVAIDYVTIDDSLDVEYKPGLYLQTKAFIEGNVQELCKLSEQYESIISYYGKISQNLK